MVNVAAAKANLSALIQEAVAGGEVIIARRGKAAVRLVVVEKARPQPIAGRWRGRVWMAPDFDAPLEDLADY